MAVPEQTPYIEYVGNGTTKAFPLTFDCEDQDHLIVTIDGDEPSFGSWLLIDGSVGFKTAPPSNSKIIFQRNSPFERTANYSTYNNSFRPEPVNKDFDRIWLKLQEIGLADYLLGLRLDKEIFERVAADLALKADYILRDSKLKIDYIARDFALKKYIDSMIALVTGDPGFSGINTEFVTQGNQNQLQINKETKIATNFYVTPQMFAPLDLDITDGKIDAYPYIKQALDSGYPVKIPFPIKAYRTTKPLIFNGNSVEGMGPAVELYGSKDASKVVIEFDGVSGTAVTNISTLSNISNIHFKQKNWLNECNGLFLERYAYFTNCIFTHFNGYGFIAHSTGLAGSPAPYYTNLTNCLFAYCRKHGIAICNGANAIFLNQVRSMWNGSISYGVAPTIKGEWDGLHINGKHPDFQSSSTAFEPQGIVVNGGDFSYNSRYGQNWERGFQSVVTGGYHEVNLVSDFRVGSSYALQINNPMCQQLPILDVEERDLSTVGMDIYNYPNHIVINGRDYGNGTRIKSAGLRSFNKLLPAFMTAGSSASARIYASPTGSIEVSADSEQRINFNSSISTYIQKFRLGNVVGALDSVNENYIAAKDTTEGSVYIYLQAENGHGALRVANGGGANAAGAFMVAPKNSVTLRSINAGGTVNTDGTDYAEYMRKSKNCGVIEKGEIVGVNKNGELTKLFDESISFVIKSTNPSFVGGDSWFNEQEPILTDHNADSYDSLLSSFKKRLEDARQRVDRIAFCGQVPINYDAKVGNYIIAKRVGNGEIGIDAIDSPNFEQYLKCVGRVWFVKDNPIIIVFNN